MALADDRSALDARLRAVGQSHLLTFHDRLPADQQAALRAGIASINLDEVPALVDRYVKSEPKPEAPADLAPASFYPLHHEVGPKAWDRAGYRAKGEELIRTGKVAAFTVAGGQGSRLGFEGPKGCYPGGAVTNKPLFACLAEWILAAQHRFAGPGVTIPWYIMTSPQNHAATVEFFKNHAFFGLAERDVMFFTQGVMPALDLKTGQILLNDQHEPSLAPDGHGGSLRALHASGAIADMRRRGVEYISYTQIDNPLVRVIDPTFLGLHAFAPDSSAEMSSKMVMKAGPDEKVGVFAKANGRTAVIEYSDLPAELSRRIAPDGSLLFCAGSIAIHIISVSFVERLNAGTGFSLPYHRAQKKIPFVDLATGQRVEPTTPNAVKLETFVFDAVPLCKSSIVLETDRTEEFAPIKNATGSDSPESCRRLQTLRAARWLEPAGVLVPYAADGSPHCTIELSPLTALWAEDLRSPNKPTLPAAIGTGAAVVL